MAFILNLPLQKGLEDLFCWGGGGLSLGFFILCYEHMKAAIGEKKHQMVCAFCCKQGEKCSTFQYAYNTQSANSLEDKYVVVRYFGIKEEFKISAY